MADTTITAASVVPATSGIGTALSAGALAIGDLIYLAAGVATKAVNDTAAHAALAGVVMSASSAANQWITYQRTGPITGGMGTTQGVVYCASPNAGKICPIADVASGKYVSIIGVGGAAASLILGIFNSGGTVA